MPARSKSQQRLFGLVHAIQKGEVSAKGYSGKVKEMVHRVDPQDAKDFAATPTKGLPEKKEEKSAEWIRGFDETMKAACGTDLCSWENLGLGRPS